MNRLSVVMPRWSALLFTIILLACCDCALAQATSVLQISGTVQDSNGSTVPRTEINDVQTATGFTGSTTSGLDGS